jgi:hypothetical protein
MQTLHRYLGRSEKSVMLMLINALLVVVMLLLITQGRVWQQQGDAKLFLRLMGRRAWPVTHQQRCKKRP